MRPLASPSRPWLVRGLVLVLVVALLAPTAVSAATHRPTDFRTGTVESPANGTTVVSIQGFHWKGRDNRKKPSGLVAVTPRGTLDWRFNGTKRGANWYYDVDPLPNGNLLVLQTSPDETTTVFELDPDTHEVHWNQTFPIKDTHDVDLINGDQLLVANMRNWDPETERNNDRLFVYDRGADEIVWEWRFRDRYPTSEGGPLREDWTHVNDVDKIGEGRYMASVRNFDQVIVVDRETGAITQRLGSDNAHDVLYEQHNPTYLMSDAGRPTILVADSENDRILEYERRDGEWVRTWKLEGGLSWPRDADRLPNGNTLVVDSLNHRVIEVTPQGRIVWEVYAPWGPYDAERVPYGDEPAGPTIRDLGATGNHTITNSAGLEVGTGSQQSFSQWLGAMAAGTPIEAQAEGFAARWAHVVPWVVPVWMDGWDAVRTLVAIVVLVGWVASEAVVRRRRPG